MWITYPVSSCESGFIINDNLIMYLSNGGEPSPDGGGSPFSVVSRRMLMINSVNIKNCI